MKKQYSQIVETVNGNSVDYFLEQVRTYENNIQKLTSKGYLNTIEQMAWGMMKGEISKYNNLLHAKGRFGTLKPLDEVMEDENGLWKYLGDFFWKGWGEVRAFFCTRHIF